MPRPRPTPPAPPARARAAAGACYPAAMRWLGSCAVLLALCSCGCDTGPKELDVIVVTVDTLRADRLGLYGAERETDLAADEPWSPRWLGARGTVFESCWAPAGKTVPSLATLWTGREPLEHGALTHMTVMQGPTYAEELRQRGYRTFGRCANASVVPAYGIHRGFEDYALRPKQREPEVGDDLLQLAAPALEAGEPLLLWAHFMAPHQPYAPPAEHDLWSDPDGPRGDNDTLFRLNREPEAADPETTAQLKALYDGDVRYASSMARDFLAGLDALTTIGDDLYTSENDSMRDLTGLDALTVIGGDLVLLRHDNLRDLSGLDNVTRVGNNLEITSNDNLVDDLFMIGLKTSNGDELWTEHYSEPEQQRLQDVAIEPGSNIVVVGELVGALNFGGKHLVSAGQLDGFAAKLTISDRAQVWAQRFGGTSSDHANSVAVDASGHVYVGGKFLESIDFGKGLVENGGGSDAYVLALDGSDGATKWVATAGDGFEQQVTHDVLHPNGDVFAAGDFWGALDFGLGPLETNGQSDAFAIRFAPTGTPSWQMAFGGPEDDTVGGMGANGLALWLAGKTSGNWQLGPYTLDGNDNDIFIAKLSIDE